MSAHCTGDSAQDGSRWRWSAPVDGEVEVTLARLLALGLGDLELNTNHDVGLRMRAAQPRGAISLRRKSRLNLEAAKVVTPPPICAQPLIHPAQQELALARRQPHAATHTAPAPAPATACPSAPASSLSGWRSSESSLAAPGAAAQLSTRAKQ